MKLSIVVGLCNSFEVSLEALKSFIQNLDHPEETEVIVIDNGSDTPFLEFLAGTGEGDRKLSLDTNGVRMRIVRNEINTGNYPLFKQAAEIAEGEIVAFLHSDVVIYEKGWDSHVRAHFDARPELGLAGFIGSTELDGFGGRGLGTYSNFMGRSVTAVNGQVFTGSVAEIHGKRTTDVILNAKVVDGCAMIFRKGVLDRIEWKSDYPPHHFYDRMMSCQVRELGSTIAVIGIEFDHFSGQTANVQAKWHDAAREWCEKNLGITSPDQWLEKNKAWMLNGYNPSRGQKPGGWDHVIYLEAERRFLQEYRDQKHLVPA